MKPTKKKQKAPLKKHSFQKADTSFVEKKGVAKVNTSVNMPFSKGNFKIMLTGIGVLLLGFIVMSLDTEEFGQGFIGLTLGPIIVVVGFAIQFFAIFHSPKTEQE